MSTILNNNNLLIDETYRILFYDLLKKLQDISNDKIHPTKNPSDKIICIVCGGRYTRSKKCIHDKTKKHISNLENRYIELLEINSIHVNL